ncbi:UDP-N-acetylmuramate dehydrogenase [Eubacterium oxidoreducens]|uniref:UDP-N-acetylenolpyruvoylglucosamine reductase n=1 Tax=Eubacterium oxidoreducens TaxID=1732 RepID=A0A1G6CAL7_EUBOX|nr:UDP-N-acetylmuramate dehydrogenase [Eubacterium oxidoreducens]SDB29900.1 UDP-N-acetylmuramate dehydrogenase [Eubacterium oxidoreducens]
MEKEQMIKTIQNVLSKEQILPDEAMAKHTSFRVGGKAKLMLTPTIEQMPSLIRLLHKEGIGYLVKGNGSNLLVGDEGIDGVVIELSTKAANITCAHIDDKIVLNVQAGCLLSKIANRALEESAKGFEFAAGIPGTFGGAVVMNAGAYGGEIKDVLKTAKILTKEGEVLELTAKELELSYRHSIVPEREYIVLGGTLVLDKGNPSNIKERMEELKVQRTTKQPLEYPSAGSTFKRPEGYFAGKLIEDAGLKGYTIGGAQVSQKHSGFVINTGDATAQDILELIQTVQAKVKEQFGVELEPEVKIVGTFRK